MPDILPRTLRITLTLLRNNPIRAGDAMMRAITRVTATKASCR
jgi:hypothetical protein